MGVPDHGVDWTTVHPGRKWAVFKRQWRFFLWALYTSIGCMMMGLFYPLPPPQPVNNRDQTRANLLHRQTGFDYGIAGTATAFPAFQEAMGIPYPSQPSGYLIPASVCAPPTQPPPIGDSRSYSLGPIRVVRCLDGRRRSRHPYLWHDYGPHRQKVDSPGRLHPYRRGHRRADRL